MELKLEYQAELMQKITANIREATNQVFADLLKQLLGREPVPADGKRLGLAMANSNLDMNMVYHVTFDDVFIGHLYISLVPGDSKVTFKPAVKN